jgi:hypothetical protein
VKRLVLATVGIGLVVSLSGCSGTGGASWSTPKEALDAVREAGFDCAPDETNSFLRDPIRGTDRESGRDLFCGGFTIALMSTEKDANLPCAPIPEGEVESSYWDETITYGNGFVIFGTDGTFPATAQPEDFQKAFDGSVATAGDLRAAVCEGNAATPSASAAESLAAPITQTLEPGVTTLELAVGETAILTVPTSISTLEMYPDGAFKVERAPDPSGTGEVLTITKQDGGTIELNFDQPTAQRFRITAM